MNETFSNICKYFKTGKRDTDTGFPVSVSIYILSLYYITYIVPFMGVHHEPRERPNDFKGRGHFEVVVPFLTTLYIPGYLACWSGLKETGVPNAATSPGTKAEKATTSAVPSPARIVGLCKTARGASGNPGLLSCYNIAGRKIIKIY